MRSVCSTLSLWAATCTGTWGAEACSHSHDTRTGQSDNVPPWCCWYNSGMLCNVEVRADGMSMMVDSRLQPAGARRDQRPPLEGPKTTASRPPRQVGPSALWQCEAPGADHRKRARGLWPWVLLEKEPPFYLLLHWCYQSRCTYCTDVQYTAGY